jgi:hypothetical protein
LSHAIQENLNILFSKQNNLNVIPIKEKQLLSEEEIQEMNLLSFMESEQSDYGNIFNENVKYVTDNVTLENNQYFLHSIVEKNVGYLYDNNYLKIISELAKNNGKEGLKFLAWTNNVVDKVNSDTRKLIYGENVNVVEKDEILVLDEPFGSFLTNEEIKVLDVIKQKITFKVPNNNSVFTTDDSGSIILKEQFITNEIGDITLDEFGKPVYNYDSVEIVGYRVLCKTLNRQENIQSYITILDKENSVHFENHCRIVRGLCSANILPWEASYYLKEQKASFKYNHAITVHRSQGSTYDKVIIDVSDLNKNKNLKEKTRMFYTALTRAKTLVILYNIK